MLMLDVPTPLNYMAERRKKNLPKSAAYLLLQLLLESSRCFLWGKHANILRAVDHGTNA